MASLNLGMNRLKEIFVFTDGQSGNKKREILEASARILCRQLYLNFQRSLSYVSVMVADPPAQSQLPTELGVVHFGLTSHVFFQRSSLCTGGRKHESCFKCYQIFSHTSCKLLCCTQGSQRFPEGAKERALNSFGQKILFSTFFVHFSYFQLNCEKFQQEQTLPLCLVEMQNLECQDWMWLLPVNFACIRILGGAEVYGKELELLHQKHFFTFCAFSTISFSRTG